MRDVLNVATPRERDWLHIAQSAPLRRKQVVEAVVIQTGLTHAAIEGGSRSDRVARPRALAAYLMHRHCTPQPSAPEIGRTLGNRDHTTILRALRRWPELRAAHPDLLDLENAVRKRLQLPLEVG